MSGSRALPSRLRFVGQTGRPCPTASPAGWHDRMPDTARAGPVARRLLRSSPPARPRLPALIPARRYEPGAAGRGAGDLSGPVPSQHRPWRPVRPDHAGSLHSPVGRLDGSGTGVCEHRDDVALHPRCWMMAPEPTVPAPIDGGEFPVPVRPAHTGNAAWIGEHGRGVCREGVGRLPGPPPPGPTGRRETWRPIGDSNPCCRRERAVS